MNRPEDLAADYLIASLVAVSVVLIVAAVIWWAI